MDYKKKVLDEILRLIIQKTRLTVYKTYLPPLITPKKYDLQSNRIRKRRDRHNDK